MWLKKCCVYLLLLALLGSGAALLFWDAGAESLSILTGGQSNDEYLLVASDAEGSVYVLGRRGDDIQIVKADTTGKQEARWKLTAAALPRQFRPAALYPASGGAVYLGLYNLDEAETTLQLYRLTEQGASAELLLSVDCTGDSLPERMTSARLSAFAEVDNVVTFAVLTGDQAQFYQRVSAVSGLEKSGTASASGLYSALALSDGTRLLAAENGVVRQGTEDNVLTDSSYIIGLTQAGTGVYYVDGASLEVFYADISDWRSISFLKLEKDAYDLDDCADLWVTRDGDVLLLMTDGRLLLDRGSTVSDLSGALARPAALSALFLAGLALVVLVVTTVLWYVLCEQRKLRLPLLLRWGGLIAAAALLAVGVLLRGGVDSIRLASAQREAVELVSSVTTLTVRETSVRNSGLPKKLADSLAGSADGLYDDAAVCIYNMDEDGQWILESSNTGLNAGFRAELSASFDREQAEAALQAGGILWSRTEWGATRWVLYWAVNGRVLAVDVNGAGPIALSQENYRWMVEAISALAALLLALSLVVLCALSIRVRRISEGMGQVAAGDRSARLRLNSGDELESLADSVNTLSDTMGELERQQNELAQSYRRFVPERVLTLLGKSSIAEVDKQTMAACDLATMMLWFAFPPEVYEKSGKELFDSVNEILERTASIVTEKGGAVFNFSYDGYDAVFEGGSAAAVSTAVAVQQEVLEINREREASGRPAVVVRIALDEGNVMIGVVGDENQIEPTSISSSFSVVKHLVELCGRLQANILCTETVMAGAAGYGSRYLGKCVESGESIRIYEIFDGDPYEVRKAKGATGDSFSEGVYALYSRDFSRAKRIFLNLVHRNAGDGGARYYLYLADQMEKRPEEEINLDCGAL